LAPGNAFSLSQSATNFMRFNVSQTLDPRVFEVLGDALAGRGQWRSEAQAQAPSSHCVQALS